jgi:hypothetical protein
VKPTAEILLERASGSSDMKASSSLLHDLVQVLASLLARTITYVHQSPG